MKRTDPWALLAILPFVLSALSSPAMATTYAKAIAQGHAHGLNCEGGFPDVMGKCWACPNGYRHDNILLPPTDGHVCKHEGGADQSKGTKIGKSFLGICKKGWLSTHDGGCYTCPNGWSHNVLKFGNQVGVCYHNHPDAYSKAARQGGSLVCDTGFFDVVDGGSCWTCPSNAPVRTLASVKSDHACESSACGAQGGRPCMITERIPSCDHGLIEDFVNHRCVPFDARQAVCMATVDAVKAGKVVVGLADVLNASRSRTDATRSKYQSGPNHDQLLAQIEGAVTRNAYAVPELKRVASTLESKRAQVEALFSAGNFCSLSVAQMNERLAALGGVPHFPGDGSARLDDGFFIRSAQAAPGEHFYMGYQIGLSGAYGAGAQVSLLFVTDFRGSGGKFLSLGPQIVTNATVGISPIGVEFFPKVDLESFTGWGFGAEASGGPEKIVGAGVDVSFDDHMVFQGFGVNGSLGFGVIPGDIGISAVYAWKLD